MTSEVAGQSELSTGGPPRRVLIVDDEPMILSIFSELIGDARTHVVTARSGEEGIGFLSTQRFDVLLTDVRMPGIGGFELVDHCLKLPPAQRPARLIVISGYCFDEALRRKYPTVRCLSKPIGAQDLLHALWAQPPQPATGAPAQDSPLQRPPPDRLSLAMAQIVGSFCHDLGNSLAVIRMGSELLELSAATEQSKEVSRHVIKAIDTAVSALADLQGFARFLRYSDAGPPVELSGPQLQSAIEGMFRPLMGENGDWLQVDTSKVQPSFRCPSLLLRHLLYSPVMNSYEALSRTTRRSDAVVRVVLRTIPLENVLLLVVADNGPGWGTKLEAINRAVAGNMPFSAAGTERGNGLKNLGRLVAKLGGRVHAGEEPNGGARIEIALPWEASHV